jgi:hypothetical protein
MRRNAKSIRKPPRPSTAINVVLMLLAAAGQTKRAERLRRRSASVTESEQRKAIEHPRRSGKGERLLEKRLKDRAEERARGRKSASLNFGCGNLHRG